VAPLRSGLAALGSLVHLRQPSASH
jgi:hypothetical protein